VAPTTLKTDYMEPNIENTATPSIDVTRLVRRCVFALLAKGDSVNGWSFTMQSKAIFELREDAEAYIPTFRQSCCDPKHFECAVGNTLKVPIVERDLYSQNAEHSNQGGEI